MFGAATVPHGRRRGAQSALLAVRAQAAHNAGCRWLVAETGAEGPGEHNASLHNVLTTCCALASSRCTNAQRGSGARSAARPDSHRPLRKSVTKEARWPSCRSIQSTALSGLLSSGP
jgi:hypothetical protein